MKKIIISLIIFTISACFLPIFIIYYNGVDKTGAWPFVIIYQSSLRTPLFTGFLTVGSFLLTLKTTILLRIKEVYDNPDYKITWELYIEQLKKSSPGKKLPGYYDSFKNLGVGLMINVVLSLVTAISQLTIGFINSPISVGFCMGLAATTIVVLLFLWYQITKNLLVWFSMLEKNQH